jgi:hypothetical protein
MTENNTYTFYEIVCKDENIDFIYVGSTKCFKNRKHQHKQKSVKNICERKLYKIINENGGWDNFEMKPLEILDCLTKTHARIREQYWIDEKNAKLNTNKAFSDKKEYYKLNKDKIKEYEKEYRNQNKDKIQKRKQEYRKLNTNKINKQRRQGAHVEEVYLQMLRQSVWKFVQIRQGGEFAMVLSHSIRYTRHDCIRIIESFLYPLVIRQALCHVHAPMQLMQLSDQLSSLEITALTSQTAQPRATHALS